MLVSKLGNISIVFHFVYYVCIMQLSPTHNIWGSPTSEERIDGPDNNQPTTQHLHDAKQEDRSRLYSPVLEVDYFKGELNPKIKFVLFERTLKITE